MDLAYKRRQQSSVSQERAQNGAAKFIQSTDFQQICKEHNVKKEQISEEEGLR